MKIALINDNSQCSKNALIYKALKKACDKYNYEVINLGMKGEMIIQLLMLKKA